MNLNYTLILVFVYLITHKYIFKTHTFQNGASFSSLLKNVKKIFNCTKLEKNLNKWKQVKHDELRYLKIIFFTVMYFLSKFIIFIHP